MPMQRDLYPEDWEAIATRIKDEVNWECEDCGKRCRRPGESIADFVDRYFGGAVEGKNTSDLIEHPQRYALSVAHLDHQPGNCDRANLKALCMPCHCRYDLRCMAQKRRLKAERLGQLRIEGV
jgi:hypothetical protein